MIGVEKVRHEVGLAIFQERVAQRYTRQDVSQAIGCTAKTVENIERGVTKINLEMYLEICSFFGKGISYFLPSDWKQIRKG